MTWYWYISKPREIFCDLDSRTAAYYALQRLRRAVVRGFLKVKDVFLFPSLSPNKFHLIVILKRSMWPTKRAMWALWFGSDKVRAVYTVERYLRGLRGCDLLIVRNQFPHRVADHTCNCPEKHKALRITNNCPVLKMLHGSEAGAEYFPRNRDKSKRGTFRIKPGRLTLAEIKRF